MIGTRDWQGRLAAFEWLSDLGAPESELTRTQLERGFELNGVRVSLLGPSGIWKPAGFELPLSIATVPSGPYSDRVDLTTNRLRYSYRGEDAQHRDNVGLRRALEQNVPLVYFYRTDPGRYLATFPVFVVGDDPAQLTFFVQVDEAWSVRDDARVASGSDAPIRREYATRIVRHPELLDAAHITADSEASGEPVVTNGLALCKLHHAAFDEFFFTVTPDYDVEVRPAIREEIDGPMLVVGLQEIHGTRILLPSEPSNFPSSDRLAIRYEAFKRAS
jgi:putative restriction endonuclease